MARLGVICTRFLQDNPLWAITGRPATEAHSWVIWDLINFAWLINPDWVHSHIVPTPVLDNDLHWQPREHAHPMREAYAVQRDEIFNDFFARLAAACV